MTQEEYEKAVAEYNRKLDQVAGHIQSTPHVMRAAREILSDFSIYPPENPEIARVRQDQRDRDVELLKTDAAYYAAFHWQGLADWLKKQPL